MVGTGELRELLTATTVAGAKTVLVGDAHQLAPVKARGGMFAQLCTELPWTQHLSEVWRLRDPDERAASLALRDGHGNRLRKAVGWYRTHHRLHTGDQIAMAADAHDAYLSDRAAGKDALLICDTWELADALNHRLHHALTVDGPCVGAARDQQIRKGDTIISRRNDATVDVRPGPHHERGEHISQVRNGNRWRVAGLDAATGRIAAERLTDNARAVFENDYVRATHHPGLCRHRALRPRRHRRHRPCRHRRNSQPRHGIRRDVARSRLQPRLHLQPSSRGSRPRAPPPARRQPRCTRCAAATNTPPPTPCV